MAIQVQIQNIDASPNGDVFVTGVLVPSGSYVSGGDTIDFTQAVKASNFSGVAESITASGAPVEIDAWSQNGNLVNQYVPIVGTLQTNNKLKISAASSFGTEFSAGAYSAAILADVIAFFAVFKKLQ